MKYGLIGEKLKHSFSKEIHETLGGYSYEIREISRSDLSSFMLNRNFTAINITIPYKMEVIKYLDYIDESVKNIGACNTIINIDNKLYGYNTDYLGIIEMLKYFNIDIKNKKVAILGTGGTSLTIKYVSKLLGAKEIITVSRFKRDNCILYQDLINNRNDVEVIFNTTPKEMYPSDEDEILDSLEYFKNLYAVVDTIYNPLRTNLTIKAENLNIKYANGLYMLISQACFAINRFINKEYSKELVESYYLKTLNKKRNIVLIGMPGCGKSTLAKKLSNVTHKRYVDTDEEIKKIIGMSISEYINTFGEEKFRELESHIILNLSKHQGLIIATGGGSILKDINVTRLKRNGYLYFINRSLENLKISDSRPLSSNYDDLEKRYKERYNIYKKVMDVEIDGDKEFNEKVKLILGR